MDSNTSDGFDVHGPKHITDHNEIDCHVLCVAQALQGNEEHRRCIAACLVKGVYVLENDRAMGRAVKIAPAWWESFGFRLENENELREEKSSIFKTTIFETIYGAIFKYVPCPRARPHPCAPRYVVAFRGTMPKHPNSAVVMKDVYLDFKILTTKLHKRTRSILACTAVKNLMAGEASGSVDVWLAGHSLGASLALEAGRAMMKNRGVNHPTFLFNPPHVALVTGINFLHPPDVAKRYLHFMSYFLKTGAGAVLDSHRVDMEKLFDLLSPWVPNLYLHEKDWICQGFIDYFELRQRFVDHFSYVGSSSMTLSYRDMLWHLLGKDKERPHLMPSAMLWKTAQSKLDPHGLHQWWKPNGELGLGAGTRYSYPVPQAQTTSTSMPA